MKRFKKKCKDSNSKESDNSYESNEQEISKYKKESDEEVSEEEEDNEDDKEANIQENTEEVKEESEVMEEGGLVKEGDVENEVTNINTNQDQDVQAILHEIGENRVLEEIGNIDTNNIDNGTLTFMKTLHFPSFTIS